LVILFQAVIKEHNTKMNITEFLTSSRTIAKHR